MERLDHKKFKKQSTSLFLTEVDKKIKQTKKNIGEPISTLIIKIKAMEGLMLQLFISFEHWNT